MSDKTTFAAESFDQWVSDLNTASLEQKISACFYSKTSGTAQLYTADNWQEIDVSEQPYYFTLISRSLTEKQLANVLGFFAAQGLSVEQVTTKLTQVSMKYTVLVIALRGECQNYSAFKEALLAVSKENQFDGFFQSSQHFHTEWKLACFDMDSTLIQCEVIDELAKAWGIGDQVAEITERAMQGELDFKASFTERLALLEGLSENVLEGIAENLPVTEGLPALMAAFKAKGIKTAIFSGGFTYFAEHLQQEFGFDSIYANSLAIENGKVTGVVQGEIVDAERKAALLHEQADNLRLSTDQVIAVGDGANDLLMLSEAGFGVAFWAKPIVKAKADYSLSGTGLDALIAIL